MGSSSRFLPFHKPSLLLIFVLLTFFHTDGVLGECYTSIFVLADSLADTGNRINECPPYCLPYGETFFHRPSGRFSDGRLVIDFIAQMLGLPFIPPYVGNKNEDFQHGVNFAVGGATALNSSFFWERGHSITTNYSLEVQLGWFKQILPSLCISHSECSDRFKDALFLVGSIGSNDYGAIQYESLEAMRSIAPDIINIISSTITTLIQVGAKTFLVPGIQPFGCSTISMVMYESQNQFDYDPSTGCIKRLIEFAQYHNHLLQVELNRLRKIHPQVTIIYADYYNVEIDLYRFPNELGFREGALKACCGGGGRYNYNFTSVCGSPEANVCDDPSLYVSWDGAHLTEAAHKIIAKRFIEGPFTDPPINISCISSKTGGRSSII